MIREMPVGKSLYQDSRYVIGYEILQNLGQNLLLMHRGWSHYVDVLRDEIWQYHRNIHIVDFDFYNVDTFNHCENSELVKIGIFKSAVFAFSVFRRGQAI